MSFADELKAEVEKIEANIDGLFHHDEVVFDDDKKAVLADAKTDAGVLKAQIESEAPQVEADASEALKNGVTDLSSKVADVVENPTHLDADLESAGEEFKTQEEPAVEQVEQTAEADAKADETEVKEQAEWLQAPAAEDAGPVVGTPEVGPASTEPAPVAVEENPEEGSEAAEIKATVDKLKADFKEAQESVPEPAKGAETPETFANRMPDHRGDLSGNAIQV